MSAVDTKFYEKKKNNTFYGSIVFFFLVLALTLGLFLYNRSIASDIAELTQKGSSIETSISEIRANPSVDVYSTYMEQKGFLEKLEKQSKISSFVTHLKSTPRRYAIEAKGFSYADGVVSMELAAQTNDAAYAYEKVVKFLREYNTLQDAPFTLKNITTFTGYDKITYT